MLLLVCVCVRVFVCACVRVCMCMRIGYDEDNQAAFCSSENNGGDQG